ncbi:MAG: hypothetical protein O2782_18895 [bacterium]|nr:hypothetical protein [bacterium]
MPAGVLGLYPPDGLVLTPPMCRRDAEGVWTPVLVAAAPGARVQVNGVAAVELLAGRTPEGHLDTLGFAIDWDDVHVRMAHPAAVVRLDAPRQTLFLADVAVPDGLLVEFATATAYGLTDPQRTYTITIDDVVDLLAELARYNSPTDMGRRLGISARGGTIIQPPFVGP